jgi:hypothetical protein
MECNSSLETQYQNYDRQQCFVAHSIGAEWNEDLKSACTAILPKFNLEPWYAADRFDPTQTLRDKVVELIANSRYGIYDISSWQDKQGNWQLPRNVFIELGIAIALNRPTLLLRHSSNNNLPLPTCLEGIETVEFTGDHTLKKELENRIPQWLDVPPDRDWLNRFCLFGNRVCSHREQHPRSQQWGRQTLHCHVSDGLDKKHHNYCQSACDEIRGAFEDIFSRYSDLEFNYLDDRSIVDGYQFLLCSHCQTVRSTPLAIYRISPTTSAETFISIGIGIALEKLFAYKIPKIILVRQEADLPSLLRGYEIVEAVNTHDIKQRLKACLPHLLTDIRQTSWRSNPLPFIESAIFPDRSDLSELDTVDESLDRYEFDGVSIDVLGLPTRASNTLKRANIYTIEDISKMSLVDLVEIKDLGIKSLEKIRAELYNLFNITLPLKKKEAFPISNNIDVKINLGIGIEVSSSIETEIEPERIFDLANDDLFGLVDRIRFGDCSKDDLQTFRIYLSSNHVKLDTSEESIAIEGIRFAVTSESEITIQGSEAEVISNILAIPPNTNNSNVYHRLESSSQTPEIAKLQENSLEIWGGSSYVSGIPSIRAFRGSLPEGKKGIEFKTDTPPDDSSFPEMNLVYWSVGRSDVSLSPDGKMAILKILTIENRQL